MIDESYLSEVHSYAKDDSQTTFQQYSESDLDSLGTTVAIVSEPTGGITDVCDEFIPELGMPQDLLNEFREIRSELSTGSDVENHNTAAEKVQLAEKYRNYLEEKL